MFGIFIISVFMFSKLLFAFLSSFAFKKFRIWVLRGDSKDANTAITQMRKRIGIDCACFNGIVHVHSMQSRVHIWVIPLLAFRQDGTNKSGNHDVSLSVEVRMLSA